MPKETNKKEIIPAWKRVSETYIRYANKINDEDPFPISLKQMIKYIKHKRQTWSMRMNNDPSLIQLLEQYRKEDLLLNRGKSQIPDKHNPCRLNINPRPRPHPLALPPHKLSLSNKPSRLPVEELDHYTPPVVESSDKKPIPIKRGRGRPRKIIPEAQKFKIPLPVVVISLSEGLKRISQLRNATTKPLKLAIRNSGRLTEGSTISQPDKNDDMHWRDEPLKTLGERETLGDNQCHSVSTPKATVNYIRLIWAMGVKAKP
ncbi:hypothetical protein BDF14DRAFT_1886952 [Spinellus fusiger]|nr:hypothetical protein BDF14DRAFT_1886952 [Spinellus fusiger]